jgi:polygalacturonase
MGLLAAAVLTGMSHSSLAAAADTPCRGGTFDVHDYGAVGDGTTLNTKSIQAAVDACARAGGGKVYLHNGTFLSGTIYLKSNVTLHLESGAVLLGSTNLDDYPVTIPAFRSYTDKYTERSLIYAEKAQNVSIIGRGVIDGQGASFIGEWKVRPYILRMIECSDVTVEGITLLNSPMWMQHYLACEKLIVRGITVYNHCNRNNDMIDIDGCRDVIISDCIGDTDDDALTLKSTSGRACENVTISNCLLSSHCNALKMGTESSGGFKNITVTNCVITVSKNDDVRSGNRNGLAGLALEIVDGGTLDGVAISNIRIDGVQNPIFLRLGNRARTYVEGMKKPGIGQFRNVKISNIIATGASRIACSITGLPGHPVENISLTDIRIDYKGGGTREDTQRVIPEEAAKYPESTMFGVLPAYGFYVRHAKNVKFRHIDLGFEKGDDRPALVCDDVTDLDIMDLDAESTPSAQALIWLKHVDGAFIHGCRPRDTVTTFVRVDGDSSNDISLMNNDLSKVDHVLEKGDGVGENAVYIRNNRTR